MASSAPVEVDRRGGGDHARAALDALDRALAKRPHADGHLLSEVTAELCAWRQGWIERRRAGALDAEGERRLGRLNAILAVVHAVHFPLGDLRWDELAEARDHLDALRGEAEGGGAPPQG